MSHFLKVMIAGALFAPSVMYAACPTGQGFFTFLCNFGDLINLVIRILGAAALLVFFWGLVKYIAKAGDEKAKEEGKNVMVYGVIALFVLFSVFGLVAFLQEAFGVESDTIIRPIEVDWLGGGV